MKIKKDLLSIKNHVGPCSNYDPKTKLNFETLHIKVNPRSSNRHMRPGALDG